MKPRRAEASSCLAKQHGLRGRSIADMPGAEFVPFKAETRMSGVDIEGRSIRKGASDAIAKHIGGLLPPR